MERINKINEFKLPEGVDRIVVKLYDDKAVFEFIPEEPKKGDWAIFWSNEHLKPLIRLYHAKSQSGDRHCDNFGTGWDNAVKWDGTKEQFEKIIDMK